MSLINQFETISNSQSYLGLFFNGVLIKLFTLIKKLESLILLSFIVMLASRKNILNEQIAQKEIMEKSTGNEMLDIYYGEGMKLFSQGPYAKNIVKRNLEEGL